MKKSFSIFKGAAFSKLGYLPFLLTFLFFAAMQVDMKAQQTTAHLTVPPNNSSPKTLFTVPTGAFVSVSVAQDRLLNAMKSLKASLAQYAEGTAPYDAAFLRLSYYQNITIVLNSGKSVAESITDGLSMLYTDLRFSMTNDQALTEKNAAIALLRP